MLMIKNTTTGETRKASFFMSSMAKPGKGIYLLPFGWTTVEGDPEWFGFSRLVYGPPLGRKRKPVTEQSVSDVASTQVRTESALAVAEARASDAPPSDA